MNHCHFNDWTVEHWLQVRQTTNAWWNGELQRSLLPIVLTDEPTTSMPAPKPFGRGLFADLSISEEQMVDQIAWQLQQQTYLGDGFPWVNMSCSGAGVLAAMTGATLHPESYDDIWFRVDVPKPITELSITFDADNPWFKRLIKIGQLILERFEGRVIVSSPDIGGVMDVLSSFRPAESLLFDLYDEPEHVLRVISEIETAWHQCFDLFNNAMSPVNPGYTAWCGIYSDVPYYMMQCDFCYMISPQMFDTFVKPTLARSAAKLDRAFYHLDGKGQLPHLPSLLEIADLNGVQWIPGDGNPPTGDWPDVFETILAEGKFAQVMGAPSNLLNIISKTNRQMHMTSGHWHTDDLQRAQAYLKQLTDTCHTHRATR